MGSDKYDPTRELQSCINRLQSACDHDKWFMDISDQYLIPRTVKFLLELKAIKEALAVKGDVSIKNT